MGVQIDVLVGVSAHDVEGFPGFATNNAYALLHV